MALQNKEFLDFEGLSKYDALIKAYVDQQNDLDQGAVEAVINDLEALALRTATVEEVATANQEAIEVLNGTGEGSVAKQVSDAIAALVDSAPQAFDTLKEIADWIASDETASAELIQKVAEVEEEADQNKADIADLKVYVDSQDEAYYKAIGSVSENEIKTLFLTKVMVAEGQSVADAIANLQEGEMVVLAADTAENLTIPADAVVDANGKTMSGDITVAEGATVINAVFTGKVVVE